MLDVSEYSLVTLVKRSQNGSVDPHVVPVGDVDSIEVWHLLSKCLFSCSHPTETVSDFAPDIRHGCFPENLYREQLSDPSHVLG